MLVLSRHRDESIIIGDNVVVTIVDIRGDKVRLGIEAPATVSVHRQEVYLAIQRKGGDPSMAGKPPIPTKLETTQTPAEKDEAEGEALRQSITDTHDQPLRKYGGTE